MAGRALASGGLPRASWIPELAMAVSLVVAPFILPWVGADVPLLSRILIWGLFGLGFSILFGYTGLLSLGQSIFYGVGGFATAWLLMDVGITETLLALLLATLMAALTGLIVGYFTERRKGIYFAMITLAFAEMFYYLDYTTFSAVTGGENGRAGVPVATILGYEFRPGLPMYGFIAVFYLASYILARRIVRSPVGRILTAIRDNEDRARATGNSVHLYKLAAFTVAAAFGGVAGGLLGIFQNYMPPDAFSFDTSGQLLMQTVIGGAGYLVGPLIGAAVWNYLHETLQHDLGLVGSWKLILGIVFVLLVSFLRLGIAGELMGRFRRRTADQPVDAPAHEASPSPVHPGHLRPSAVARPGALGEVVLEARHLTRRFGGIVANEDISVQVREFEVRGLIGPNGAGKSTFFKMLAGELEPSAGDVCFYGEKITGLGVTAVCRMGMAKSYQINQLFDRLTVQENLLVPSLAHARGAFRLDMLRSLANVPGLEANVAHTLQLVNLAHRADTPVAHLAYGEKRRLEIGLALATNPKVLLLDEPLAGMSPAERADTVQLLKELRAERTMVIVEHDMDAVFDLADRITVLVEGRLLLEGTPEEIRGDPRVQEAYLGGLHEETVADGAGAGHAAAGAVP
jgi:branched-chain amino acid transport system permease protein